MAAPNGGVRDLGGTANTLKTHEDSIADLLAAAWAVRRNARILGDTAVGAAVLATSRSIYVGCNVEHQFRSHDVHAEVNALSSMIAGGDSRAVAVAVASERERFTPCGACMDWIFELGGADCKIYVVRRESQVIGVYSATDLMPLYPA